MNKFFLNLKFSSKNSGKINFLKRKRSELLEVVNSGPYSQDQDYIYEAIYNLTEEIMELENEKRI